MKNSKLLTMMNKYTKSKHNIGISGEFSFIVQMDITHQVKLDNLNETDQFSSVDFQIQNTNIFIELKTRTCKSTAFETTVFDISKCKRWQQSKVLQNATIYIAFLFIDGEMYFIKYNHDIFAKFDTEYRSDWNQTNFLIPFTACIDVHTFVKEINHLTPK